MDGNPFQFFLLGTTTKLRCWQVIIILKVLRKLMGKINSKGIYGTIFWSSVTNYFIFSFYLFKLSGHEECETDLGQLHSNLNSLLD
jgi:hypothetical protein